ncbi:hypothetical protein BZM27_09335 [Paraburkholderia steynii]|uniref:Uncharacterized protein n=1 Tax=Paraburkholderia steynii TaxID=1245441 RepID=A0A4R0XEC9_9BURK|nr:hypothetical protein BZM27_09335 [Paraburkholderia steynii]
MTFFANSGVTFPKFEEDTHAAGSEALEAAASIWRMFAALERNEGQSIQRSEVDDCAQMLLRAASTYHYIATELRNVHVRTLTPAEFQQAAIPHHFTYDVEPLNSMIFSPQINMGDLYREIAQRAELLSSTLKIIPFDRDIADLAPQVFNTMRQWEYLSYLGRVVSVLNRRPPNSVTDGF